MDIESGNALIDALGGTVETAKLCDVSSQAVSQWRQFGIPKARRMYLLLLRPELAASKEGAAAKRQTGTKPANAQA